MSTIQHVREGDWQALETRNDLVFVDFWAEWCTPCRMLAPTFESLAEKCGKEIVFAKVNVDELPDLANQFGIRSIPTLILFKNGKVLERWLGTRSYRELADALEGHLSLATKQ